ncbi:MAG: MarR family winged helix-turn-helix transcriptional regulator [Acidimicrobiia bacterium]
MTVPVETAPFASTAVADADLARALTTTLYGVLQQMKQHSARRSGEFDMSVAQVRALYALREPLSMRELAERLFLDPSNLTALVDRLEELGLVERTADAEDRRVKRLIITERGARLADEVVDAVFAQSPVFEALSTDEQRELLDLLTRVANTTEP